MIKKLKIFIQELLEGIYSGIPICCVISYCKGRKANLASKEHGSWEQYVRKFPAEYVQCHKCESTNKFIKIRENGSLF